MYTYCMCAERVPSPPGASRLSARTAGGMSERKRDFLSHPRVQARRGRVR